jgi:hypothetical protein
MAPQAPARRGGIIQKTEPTRQILPGDLICGQCGEGNAPTRKFCSRCGTSLAEAAVARTPWWSKLLPRRRRKQLAAGERPWGSPTERGAKGRRSRPSLGKVVRPLLQLAGIAVLIIGLVYGASSPFRDAVNKSLTSLKTAAWSKVKPQYDQVRATSARASSELPSGPASGAVDGATNTFWITQPTDAQPVLLVTFGQPVSISKIIVHNGRPDNYQSTNRPELLHFVFPNHRSADVTLKDDPGPHTYSVSSGGKVTSAEIHILQEYTAFSPSGAALAEMEFFRRK